MSDDRKRLVWFIGARAGEIPRVGFCPWKAFAGCHAPFNHTIGISLGTVSSCVGGTVLEGCLAELEEPPNFPSLQSLPAASWTLLASTSLGFGDHSLSTEQTALAPSCLQPAASLAHR